MLTLSDKGHIVKNSEFPSKQIDYRINGSWRVWLVYIFRLEISLPTSFSDRDDQIWHSDQSLQVLLQLPTYSLPLHN